MKKAILIAINVFTAVLFIVLPVCVKAQETQVKVTGTRSGKGKIILNVFKDQADYDNEKPFKEFVFDKHGLVNGTLTVKCGLEPGVYGITLVDDENANGKLDKNFIRMPKEGFGFSNFFMEKLRKPAFDDFKVDLRSPNKTIEIKIKYM